MQIIQNIRDKGAAIVIVVIALSLIGFILMDAQQGGSKLFAGMNNNVGSVGGQTISANEFNNRYKQLEEQEAQNGQPVSGTRTYQLRDQLWNQLVAEKIFFKEAAKLGIDFTGKELGALLLSNDQANPFLKQGLAGPDGKLDLAKAQEALANIKKFTGARREAVNAQIVDPARIGSMAGKYSSLITSSAYYPTWMQERDAADANNFATISYVSVPYGDISDSTVTISDADINSYVSKHKDLFKQEAGRKISYISFSQLPNAADSAQTLKSVEDLKAPFQADSNAKSFVARNGSSIMFEDAFNPKSKLQTKMIDSIAKYPIGTVVGPLLEDGKYLLAKIVGTKEMPDSVRARHILIATKDKNGQPVEDSVAKKQADSLFAAIKAGADFGALAQQFSADAGSGAKGGDLGFFGYGTMVPEFNEFTFTKPVGSKDVVRTQFGYHIIDITAQKEFKPAYKIAYMAKDILPSELTINNASLAATKAAAEKNSKALSSYAAKNGLQVIAVPTIVKENDYTIGALQDARQVVRWAFEHNPGDVSEPFGVGDAFIVATVDAEVKEGTMDAAAARTGAEAEVRKQKKADIIKAKLGANPTLESTASAFGKQVLVAGADSSITFASNMIKDIGPEARLIGASFNKEYQTKVSPAIVGENGVYVMKVNSVQAKTPAPEAAQMQASTRLNALKGQVGNWFEGLRKQAEIKDKRSNLF